MVTTVLAEKRLQLLHDLLPKAELIALLINPTSPVAEPQTRDAQAAARALGVRLEVLTAVTENDFDQVFATGPAMFQTFRARWSRRPLPTWSEIKPNRHTGEATL